MEDFGSLWTFPENVDELKQKVQYMTYELEITKKEADEETRKNNDQIQKLLQLLQTAIKERDEAKSQLNKLKRALSFNQPLNIDQIIPPFSPDTPLFTNYPAKSNSGITDSNTNPQSHSHVSSPVVDSLSYNPPPSPPASTVAVDHATLIIEKLAKGRPLPPKGSLMQAVREAGPILETLLVAGSLPRWRNPPALLSHPIPTVNLGGCGGGAGGGIKGYLGSSSVGYGQNCNGSIGYSSPSSMLNFGSGSSGNCLMGSAGGFDYQISKRQRFL